MGIKQVICYLKLIKRRINTSDLLSVLWKEQTLTTQPAVFLLGSAVELQLTWHWKAPLAKQIYSQVSTGPKSAVGKEWWSALWVAYTSMTQLTHRKVIATTPWTMWVVCWKQHNYGIKSMCQHVRPKTPALVTQSHCLMESVYGIIIILYVTLKIDDILYTILNQT